MQENSFSNEHQQEDKSTQQISQNQINEIALNLCALLEQSFNNQKQQTYQQDQKEVCVKCFRQSSVINAKTLILQLSCGHFYCFDCIQETFSNLLQIDPNFKDDIPYILFQCECNQQIDFQVINQVVNQYKFSSKQCQHCLNHFQNKDILQMESCGHHLCYSFLVLWLEDKLSRNDFEIQCFICNEKLQESDIAQIATQGQLFEMYKEQISQYSLKQQGKRVVICRKCKNQKIIFEFQTNFLCSNCNEDFCSQCLLENHQDMTCQKRQLIEQQLVAARLNNLLTSSCFQCKKQNSIIQRREEIQTWKTKDFIIKELEIDDLEYIIDYYALILKYLIENGFGIFQSCQALI